MESPTQLVRSFGNIKFNANGSIFSFKFHLLTELISHGCVVMGTPTFNEGGLMVWNYGGENGPKPGKRNS